MNKAQATKLAKTVQNDGHRFGIRHYGKGSWAVEIEEGRVFNTEEAYENWKESQALYAAQAQADKEMYGYAENE